MSFYTIAPTSPFADTLAVHCDNLAIKNNIPLSTIKIFLPTRRGIRTLQNAFLRKSNGKARILPIMQSIGDVDLEEVTFSAPQSELIKPAINPLRRQMILARMLEKAFPQSYNYQQALNVSKDLGGLIDQIHTENLPISSLKKLIEEQEFAIYWEMTIEFLELILNNLWPAYLDEVGMIDSGLHRRLRIESLTKHYSNNPPKTPVIMAGSTGSIPATRNFIKTVTQLENGQIILPALDTIMDDANWVEVNAGHPQFLLKQLLSVCNVKRADVIKLTAHEESNDNDTFFLMSQMMKPAQKTDEWQSLTDPNSQNKIINALKNITICNADNDHHEASIIAIAMAEIAFDPSQTKTATLITPDRNLSTRVRSILKQWNIDIDDSAGTSLSNSAIGQFCMSVIQSIQNNEINPISLFTTLKSSYAGGGDFGNTYRTHVREIEKKIFRGLKPHILFDELAKKYEDNSEFLIHLSHMFDPLIKKQNGKHNLQSLITTHLQIMEDIAKTSNITGANRLWHGDDGEALALLLTNIQAQSDICPDMSLHEYIEFIQNILQTETFTSKYGKHPRLSILGQIESRMFQSDRVILSGLNEGIWPPDSGFDTWMSRSMRSQFGLPSLEQKTTLAAHDFSCGFCSKDVFITRSNKSNGQPTLISRWLQRLQTILIASQIDEKNHPFKNGEKYVNWANKLRESDIIKSCSRPAPSPKTSIRPVDFSVTEIEKWMRNPYWIYAKKILKLKKMDDLDKEVSVADRGILIHGIMEKFTNIYNKSNFPDTASDDLLSIGKNLFDEYKNTPEIHGLWWSKFIRASAWIINHEKSWRHDTINIYSEQKGVIEFKVNDISYSLFGKADRIERRENGEMAIIDYKTGSPPAIGDVNAGISSQLVLESLILQNQGFKDIHVHDHDTHTLLYWNLGGSKDGGEAKIAQGTSKKALDTEQLSSEAFDGLRTLFEVFQDENTPYIASPNPTCMMKIDYNDYAHLERIAEWNVAGEDGDN